jgi:hypothetical protein
MFTNRKLATGAAAGALALGTLMSVGAGPSVAAPAHHHHHHHHHCPSKHGHYPPGKCKVYFAKQHDRHHHTEIVGFTSGQVFKGGERVIVVINCPASHGHRKHTFTQTRHAYSGGRVIGSFTVHETFRGSCTVTMTGHHSGVRVSGTVTL